MPPHTRCNCTATPSPPHRRAQAKLERIMTDAPMLLMLLEEFKTKSATLREHIAPLVSKLQAGELATDKGVAYLEVRLPSASRQPPRPRPRL